MTQPAPSWRRQRIPEIGLSFDVNPAWALDVLPLDDGTIVSQRLPDDAVVFVRYGRGQTLDRFLADLGDMLTTATILSDESTRLAGVSARRVTVRLDRRPIPGASSQTPILLRVTGFAAQRVPVLVGYRMREDQAAKVQATLESIVGNVALADDDGSAYPVPTPTDES